MKYLLWCPVGNECQLKVISNYPQGVPIYRNWIVFYILSPVKDFFSVFKGCREVTPVIKKQGSGHIVNVTSTCAHHARPSWAVYTAVKAGLVGFTRCHHFEMAELGEKTSNFVPGAARTGFCDVAELTQAGWKAAQIRTTSPVPSSIQSMYRRTLLSKKSPSGARNRLRRCLTHSKFPEKLIMKQLLML